MKRIIKFLRPIISVVFLLAMITLPGYVFAQTASKTVQKKPGIYVSPSAMAEVTILNDHPENLKLRFEYGEGNFGLKSNTLNYFDNSDKSRMTATLTGLNSGRTYQYRIVDVNGVLSPSTTESFTYVGSGLGGAYGGYTIGTISTRRSGPIINPDITKVDTTPPSPIYLKHLSYDTANNSTGASGVSNNSNNSNGLACKENCNFNALIALINRVIHFVLFAMAVPIAAIMFAYAGVLSVTSGGSTESRGKAKNIFTNTLDRKSVV